MQPDPIDDLLEQLCRGDKEAAEQVFVRYEPYLRMVVRRMLPARLRTQFDSVDVVHSVWSDLLTGFREAGWRFVDAAHLRAFLVKATRNRFIDKSREEEGGLGMGQSLERTCQEQMTIRPDERPSQIAQGKELWERIMANCPPDHRPLLLLKRQGHSVKDIAAKMNYHPSHVRRILYDLARCVAFPQASQADAPSAEATA